MFWKAFCCAVDWGVAVVVPFSLDVEPVKNGGGDFFHLMQECFIANKLLFIYCMISYKKRKIYKCWLLTCVYER